MVPAYVSDNSREVAPLQTYRRINLGVYTCLSLSFLGPIHPVLESVYQCLPGGFDDVFPDALAVGGVYKDAGCGGGRPVLVEDAHLVVGEVDFFKLRVVGTYGLPEGPVESVHGAIAFRGGDHTLPLHQKLDGRLDRRLAVSTLFGDDPEALQFKERLRLAGRPPDEEGERGVGRLVVVALVLPLLYRGEDRRDVSRLQP